MKLLQRAAAAALVPLTAAAAALLPVGPAMADAATPPPASQLIGTWANINPNSQNVKDIVFSATADGIATDAFSACAPTACEWGNVPTVTFTQNNTPGIDSTTDSAFRSEWTLDHGHGRNLLVGQLQIIHGLLTLVVQEPHIFIPHRDGSDSADSATNYTVGELFRPAAAMTPTFTGTGIVNNYPMGNFNSSIDALLGSWTDTAGAGITKIELGKNTDGTLAVHAYGTCTGFSPCDWGETSGITFGPSSTATATNFLAHFTFDHKNTVICVAIDSTGTTLTVHQFTDYLHLHGHGDHDHDAAPSNSHLVDILTKA